MQLVNLLLIIFLGYGSCADPPAEWKENWFEHDQVLTRQYFDTDVAIYFDKDVDKSLTWMNTYLHDVWVYVKKTYGDFGDDPHLYAIFHTGRYSGGHAGTYFDEAKSYRNAIDVGYLQKDAWTSLAGDDLDFTAYCVGFIVIGARHNIHGSPEFQLCGYQWIEIMIYDIYLGINRTEDARRYLDLKIAASHDTPRPKTYWFRDWFLPIYEQFGGSKVLDRYFTLVAENIPTTNTSSFNRPKFARDMNFGELVHFWSGAVKISLRNLATQAFGWSEKFDREFQKARKDFPNVEYYNIIL